MICFFSVACARYIAVVAVSVATYSANCINVWFFISLVI